MTNLVKIGNSRGIRIPKTLIEQAHLDGKELKLKVIDGGIFISPVNTVREGWNESINKTLSLYGMEEKDKEWLEAELTSNAEMEW